MSTTSRTQNTGTTRGQENQEFDSSTTYGWENMPDTADIANYRNFQFPSDPRIGNTFARNRSQAHESFHNPLGGYTTPQLRDAVLRASDADSSQQEAQAFAEENYARQGQRAAQLHDVANLTAPRMVARSTSGRSSGSNVGSTTGSGSQSTPLLPGIIQAVAGVGSAYLG